MPKQNLKNHRARFPIKLKRYSDLSREKTSFQPFAAINLALINYLILGTT